MAKPAHPRLPALMLVLLGASLTGCVMAAGYEVPRPGDAEPALTSSFGTDYTGSGVARFRPRGRFAAELSCPSGHVTVLVRAEDEVLVSLELDCITNPRREFDLTAGRTAEVTFSALSNGTAEGVAALYWLD